MRFSLFWDATQRRLVVTDVSGQPICPIYMDLPLEYGTVRLSHKVGNYQIYAA
jgi:hypothetical protein